MLSRRERRQYAADMELGRRYPYLYGIGAAAVAALLAAVAGVVLLAWWLIAPQGLLTAARWALMGLGVLLAAWLFWWAGIRKR